MSDHRHGYKCLEVLSGNLLRCKVTGQSHVTESASRGLHERADHETVVEYAAQEMLKGKSPKAAAKSTAVRLSGGENLFLGPGISVIDEEKLEELLWHRMVEMAKKNISRMKPGNEAIGVLGTLDFYQQKGKSVRAEFVRRMAREGISSPELSP